MDMSVYKMTEIVGTSPAGLEKAIQEAVGRASKTLRNVHWFEVKEIRGTVKEGQVGEYQVRLTVGFKLDD
ncbi:MAG: dodecin domain-containing protein [Burkholderiales bacterium]|jgi:flavin-binding protein dodecin|nr:dodecin domain-containing protein [Burkholderiales bacterium]